MAGSTEMKLVFRLNGVGFSLPVNLLVEIVQLDQQPAAVSDESGISCPVVMYRDEQIPVVDVAQRFSLNLTPMNSLFTMLVLHGELGLWGALVDEIEGIRPNGEFLERGLSPLFSLAGAGLYDRIDVWRNEPLIRFNPERFAPGGNAS